MSNSDLFNSKTQPVPRLRPDLDIMPVQNNGDSYIYFQDMRGYVADDFALDRSAGTVLSLLDGRTSINDLKPRLGNGVSTNQLLQYIQFLDENCVLYSPYFRSYVEEFEREYEQSKVHHSVTAGSSYPAEPEELKNQLDKAFDEYGEDKHKIQTDAIKALYAPHIDPRVGMKSYVESFQFLEGLEPKRVVILATSHYAGLHVDLYQNKPFIISNKDFAMPMGTVPADREAVQALMQHGDLMGLSSHDRAHRMEHSIELHLLFLQYIWQHEFLIVPIVVAGFDDLFYMNDSHLSSQIANFTRQLHSQFGEDDETLFLISGDLAHIGKKFGDDQPASSMQKEVKKFDEQFLKAGESGSTEDMLSLMKQNYDPYHICGFPPLYTFLKAFPDLKGQTVSYNRWNETERESAVTFGSIVYRNIG